MRLKELEKLGEIAGNQTDRNLIAGMVISSDGNLARRIIEDWLGTSLPLWEMFYSELSTSPLEGHLAGPSPAQEHILRRMRDKGHRLAPVRGFFRWIGGSDERAHRVTVALMIERGWLRMVESQVMGLEYLIIPTREGMVALANNELDKDDRVWP